MFKKLFNYYNWGGRFLNDSYHIETEKLNKNETKKNPLRSDIINYLLKSLKRETIYLEIGVRNPEINFNKIVADKKYSVDPGIEFAPNPVDFKLTSDAFFEGLKSDTLLNKNIKFDVIFVDGLHLADQVERDIHNSLDFIKDDGFIVLHDCNPPTEWHAREAHRYEISPAMQNWNGTTWKAFVKERKRTDIYSCCIDTDWGVGIISKKINFGPSSTINNPFFEFHIFAQFREKILNLISFNDLKKLINS